VSSIRTHASNGSVEVESGNGAPVMISTHPGHSSPSCAKVASHALEAQIGSSPAAIVPRTCSRMGVVADAPAVRVEDTAKPSMAEVSNEGEACGLR